MSKELKPLQVFIIIALFAVAIFFLFRTSLLTKQDAMPADRNEINMDDTGAIPGQTQGTPVGKDAMVAYANENFDLSFQYPSSLYVKTSETPTMNPPKLTLLLVRGTQENIDLIEGKPTIPREGPISITITAQADIGSSSALEIAKREPTWSVAKTGLSETKVQGMTAYSYEWSGLYEGKTIIISKDDIIYVLSVSWMDADDQLVKDFNMIIDNLDI